MKGFYDHLLLKCLLLFVFWCSQKRVLGLPELEEQTVVAHPMWVLRAKPVSSGEAVCALNCRAVSAALFMDILQDNCCPKNSADVQEGRSPACCWGLWSCRAVDWILQWL